MNSTRRDARLINLLGAMSTGFVDQARAQITDSAHFDETAAAALIALLDFTPRGSVHTLSTVVGLTHSGTVRLVSRLATAGLVERSPGRDARSVTLTLTLSGRKAARRLRARRHDDIAETLTGLTDRQRMELARACEVIVANLAHRRLAQRDDGAKPAGGALCRRCDFAACGRAAGTCPAAQAVAVG